MKTTKKRASAPELADIEYAIRSFLGHLEGTQKSVHTIRNYRSDLLSFRNFLQTGLGIDPVALFNVSRKDLEAYYAFLKAEGFKTNTRRRKLLTVRKLLKYLSKRKKIAIDVGRKLPAPHKVERIPATIDSASLIAAIRALPSETVLDARNRALLWTLTETGCLVSEASRIRYENWGQQTEGGQTTLYIDGKSARTIPVSRELYAAIQELRQRAGETQHLFLGFNRFGPLGSAITPRGVEILVHSYAARLGFPELTPRTLRHSAVVRWSQEGMVRADIQKRLGLKTSYAFRVYDPLIKSSSKTTSIA